MHNLAMEILKRKMIKLYKLLCIKDDETPYYSESYGNFSY